MQLKDAAHLRLEWGNAPCDHPGFDREYYLGAHTGDCVCTKCGRELTKAEVQKIREARINKNES